MNKDGQLIPTNQIFDLKYYNKKGIYFLFDKDKNLIYIGISKCIRRRINQHLYSSQKKFEDDFIKFISFIELSEETFLNAQFIEKQLIKYYEPLFNNISYKLTKKLIKTKWKS